MASHEQILDYFRILDKRNSLGTSYLFIGQDTSVVVDIIKLINCKQEEGFCNKCWDCQQIQKGTHPDLFIVKPEGLATKIATIREAIKFFSLKSFRLEHKAIIIEDGTSLSPAASNAFLKTLEEPPKGAFIGICVSKLEGILPTTISRCRKIFLPSVSKEPDTESFKHAKSFLKGGDLIFKDRQKFSQFLKALIILIHEDILKKANYKNNQLLLNCTCEIIAQPYDISKMQDILKDILKIYAAAKNINMNLALNLIKMRF